MCFDSHDNDFRWSGGREMASDRGDPHAKAGFINMLYGGREVEFGTGFAEAGTVLGGRVDGNVENSGCFEHFLGRGDYLLILPYWLAKCFLDITYKKGRSSEFFGWLFRHGGVCLREVAKAGSGDETFGGGGEEEGRHLGK
jgi:hypothetical protein